MKILLKGYCAKVDIIDDNTIYKGYPAEGTVSENTGTWAIEKLTRDPGTGIWTILWAEGTEECIFKWSDRTTLVYEFLT